MFKISSRDLKINKNLKSKNKVEVSKTPENFWKFFLNTLEIFLSDLPTCITTRYLKNIFVKKVSCFYLHFIVLGLFKPHSLISLRPLGYSI